jgi:thiol-disulfide isomerase/thioredoxin
MKHWVLFFLLAFCGTLVAQSEDTTFAIHFNSKSYFELHCENCPADADYFIEYRSFLASLHLEKFALSQVSDGVFASEIDLHYPQMVRLVRKNPQSSYVNLLMLVPNDTLKIQLRYEEEQNKHTFEKVIAGRYPELTEYFVHRVNELRYYETDFALAGVPDEEKKGFLQNEINFVKSYHQKKLLPIWFLNKEIETLRYYVPYESLDNRPISNRHALGSTYYMFFLDRYLRTKIDDNIRFFSDKEKLVIDTITNPHLNYAKYFILQAKNDLDFEVSEFYKLHFFLRFLMLNIQKSQAEMMFSTLDFQDAAIKAFAQERLTTLSQLTSYVEEKQAIPEFLVQDREENMVLLNDFLGKTVYISFWFPSCSPCITSTPDKNRLLENLSSEEFELIHICVSGTEQEWQKAIDRFDMKGKHLFINSQEVAKEMTQLFGITFYPHYAILKDGKIVIRKASSPSVVETELRQILKAK